MAALLSRTGLPPALRPGAVPPALAAGVAPPQQGGGGACRHFRQGRCTYADCRFSHAPAGA
eukprot:gene47197-14861_t